MIPSKARLFFRSLYNGVLGVGVEIIMTAVFIAAGFLVCLAWWGFFQ